MSKETVGYTENNYDPINNAIEESIRTQRAKSSWQYAKVFALVLASIGILCILLAWAYSIYKKPNSKILDKLEKVEKIIYQEKEIEKKFNQDSQKIVNSKKIVYNKKTTRFFNHTEGSYNIITGYIYSTVKDLLEGKQPKEKYCYIEKGATSFSFDRPATLPLQQKALKEIGLTPRSVLKYKSYCNYN